VAKKLYTISSHGFNDSTQNFKELMVAHVINQSEPYQIDFMVNDFGRASSLKPVSVYDCFSMRGFTLNFPVIRRQDSIPNQTREIELDSSSSGFFLMNERAFDALKELLLLDQGSQLFVFYFEQKPFYMVIPPVLLTPEQETLDEWSKEWVPDLWHFFLISSKSNRPFVDQVFVDAVHKSGVTGINIGEWLY
jgi:hypothetical protein